jgi:hypothetical protein
MFQAGLLPPILTMLCIGTFTTKQTVYAQRPPLRIFTILSPFCDNPPENGTLVDNWQPMSSGELILSPDDREAAGSTWQHRLIDAREWHTTAAALLRRSDPAAAAGCLRTALRILSSSASGLNTKTAAAQPTTGDEEETQTTAAPGRELKPAEEAVAAAAAHQDLGVALARLGDLRRAAAHSRLSLRRWPPAPAPAPPALLNLASALDRLAAGGGGGDAADTHRAVVGALRAFVDRACGGSGGGGGGEIRCAGRGAIPAVMELWRQVALPHAVPRPGGV